MLQVKLPRVDILMSAVPMQVTVVNTSMYDNVSRFPWPRTRLQAWVLVYKPPWHSFNI